MFDKLPSNIISKIFEYDPTYHNIYKKLHEEFFNCSRTWRIISKRSKDEEERGWYYRQYTPYNMTYGAAKKLANYWNYDYRYDKKFGDGIGRGNFFARFIMFHVSLPILGNLFAIILLSF